MTCPGLHSWRVEELGFPACVHSSFAHLHLTLLLSHLWAWWVLMITEPNGFVFKCLVYKSLPEWPWASGCSSVPQFPLLEDWDNNNPYLREVGEFRVNHCNLVAIHGVRSLHWAAFTPPHTVQLAPKDLLTRFPGPRWVLLGAVSVATFAPGTCSHGAQNFPLLESCSSWE